MVVINLYGVLESVAQRSTKLYVETFDEAIRALFANFPRLRKAMENMRVSVLVDGKSLTFEDCIRPYKSERIDIMPIIGGTGPAIMIVVGAAMAWGASTLAAMTVTSSILSVAAAATLQTFIASMGISLILGGISQILFKPPKPALAKERPENATSYTFNGAVNTTSQGNVVPVGFGRLRVGSQVLSTNVQTWDIPVAPNTTTPPPAPPPVPELWNSPDYGNVGS